MTEDPAGGGLKVVFKDGYLDRLEEGNRTAFTPQQEECCPEPHTSEGPTLAIPWLCSSTQEILGTKEDAHPWPWLPLQTVIQVPQAA